MSIFDSIRNAIFRHGGRAQAQSGGQAQGTVNRAPAGTSGASTTTAPPRPAAAPAGTPAQPQARPAAQPAPAAASAQPQVDVEAVLEKLQPQKGQQLNWRTSIVDLMKLLDLDSSLDNRKQLAQELGYTGSTSDSATMNVWLHRQVMKKLAENGGRVPADLKD